MKTPTTRTGAEASVRVDAELRRLVVARLAVAGGVVGAVAGFLVLDVIGLVIGALVIGGIGVAFSIAAVGRVVSGALDVVTSSVDARAVDAEDFPRLFNLLEGLCAVTGVQVPRVLVTRDNSINALVAADPSRTATSVLVVTDGFVTSLERIEMEGAVAVCLARLRSGIAETQTLAASLTMNTPWFLGSSAARRLAARANSTQLVFDADVKGAGITRYPPGLAAAYSKMVDGSTRVARFSPETAGMWLADPAGETDVAGDDAVINTPGSRVESHTEDRPPLVERLALLREI